MYETTPGTSINSIARDHDIIRNALKGWVTKYSGDRRASSTDKPDAVAVTNAERIRRLERTTSDCGKRDILRRAAKSFAEENCLVSRLAGSLMTPVPTTRSGGCARF